MREGQTPVENGTPKPGTKWQDLARALQQEQDPKKAIDLAQRLNEALLAEEKQKADNRGEQSPKEISDST